MFQILTFWLIMSNLNVQRKLQLWLDINGLDLIFSSTLQLKLMKKGNLDLITASFISPQEITVEVLGPEFQHYGTLIEIRKSYVFILTTATMYRMNAFVLDTLKKTNIPWSK